MSEAGARRSVSASFARLVVHLRFPILVFWIGAAVAAVTLLPTIREAQVGSLGDLVPNDADAIATERRSAELFGFPLLGRTLVVQRDPGGLSPASQREVVERVVALNREALPGLESVAGAYAVINTLGEPPFSKEEGTTAITYLFFPPDIGQVGRGGLAELFVERYVSEPDDAAVGVTGTIPARTAQADAIKDALPLVELATGLFVAAAMALYFRAPAPPLVNMLAVGIAYLISIRLIAYAGSAVGVSVPSEVEPVIVVLLFGVVTDYSIFFLSRFRRRLAEGQDARIAAELATAELLPIIVTAGLTIVGGSSALVIAELGFLQAFGPGMAVSVGIGLLVAITLVPAMLAIAGRFLFWPGSRHPPGERHAPDRGTTPGREPRSIRIATSHPLATAVACTAVLLTAATGVLGLEPANPLIRGLPDTAPAERAYRAASEGFAVGILAPTVVVVEEPGVVARRRALVRLERLLARQPGVAEVIGPANAPQRRPLGGVFSPTGDAARYLVVLDADPLGSQAIDYLDTIQARMPVLLEAAGLPAASASFAGDTALAQETVEGTFDDLRRVAPATLLIVFLILVAFLRALVAPLYLVASSVLALAASLGIAVYVFEDLLGYGELTYYVPFAAAVLLVSLGSDYNVFLVGRIWIEARRRRGMAAAVSAGASGAARPIAVAGLILSGSFALLAIVPVRAFRELAFTMSIGLLIDAFLVRTLLVPAIMSLAGRRSVWPGRWLEPERDGAPVDSPTAPVTE